VVIGPGLGLGPEMGIKEETKKLVVGLAKELSDKKMVIDADGSTAISEDLKYPARKCGLTPHRGEFRRLSNQDPTAENVAHFCQKIQMHHGRKRTRGCRFEWHRNKI